MAKRIRYRKNYQLMNEEGHSWWLYSDLEGDYFRPAGTEREEEEEVRCEGQFE